MKKLLKIISIYVVSALVLGLIGYFTIKIILVKKPISVVEQILDSKADKNSISSLKRYFDPKYLSLPKESSEKLKTATHTLSQEGDVGEVKVTMLVQNITSEGVSTEPVAKFYLKKSLHYPNYWQVEKATELNPLFSQTIADILPVKDSSKVNFDTEINYAEGIKAKLSNFKVEQTGTREDPVTKFSYNFSVLGPNLTNLDKQKIYFSVEDKNNNTCSNISQYIFQIPSHETTISNLQTTSICSPGFVRIFIPGKNNLTVSIK